MQIVVDTNILYSFFWKDSFTRSVLLRPQFEFYAPELALEEINEHKKDIMSKARISEKEFNSIRADIAVAVNFVPLVEYQDHLKKALAVSPDANDIDFFALAMQLKTILWSNDEALKNQKEVVVLSTLDFINKPEFAELFFE